MLLAMRKLACLLVASVLTLGTAVAQEGPEADELIACLLNNGVSRLQTGADLDTAYTQSWDACSEEAAKVPVEYDGIDFDGLEGVDEVAYHWLLDISQEMDKSSALAFALERLRRAVPATRI